MVSTRDNMSYTHEDSGCKVATEYMGYQSICFKCPFRNCVLGRRMGIGRVRALDRKDLIMERYQQGESVRRLAVTFKVNIRTVQRALAGVK